MTPLAQLLSSIGWTAAHLADRLDMAERQARRWETGHYPTPEPVLAWLRRVDRWLVENPPPGRPTP